MTKRYTSPSFLITIIIVLVIGAYVYFQSYNLIEGPVVQTITPKNGELVDKSLIEIEGVATNISFITLNDRQIFTNEEGFFKEKLLLSYGYNLITIKAKDRFGRNTKEVLEIIYQ